jgi:hypothetical protein
LVTRWFSKYEVSEFPSALLSSLQAVIYKLIASNVLPMSASKLLELINHDVKSLYVKIEQATFVEVLFPLRNISYAMEGDGNLAFQAREWVDTLALTYPMEIFQRWNLYKALCIVHVQNCCRGSGCCSKTMVSCISSRCTCSNFCTCNSCSAMATGSPRGFGGR